MTAQRNRKPFKSDRVDMNVFNDIVEQMMNGKTLSSLCSLPEYPDYSVFVNWVAYDQDLYKIYARAKQVQADYFAESIVDISDTDNNPQRARNRMDSRRWHASKIAPRKYGDRVLNELSGSINQNVKVDLSNMTPEMRQQLRQALLKQMDAPPLDGTSYKVIK